MLLCTGIVLVYNSFSHQKARPVGSQGEHVLFGSKSVQENEDLSHLLFYKNEM